MRLEIGAIAERVVRLLRCVTHDKTLDTKAV